MTGLSSASAIRTANSTAVEPDVEATTGTWTSHPSPIGMSHMEPSAVPKLAAPPSSGGCGAVGQRAVSGVLTGSPSP